jgi:hypothetical protein
MVGPVIAKVLWLEICYFILIGKTILLVIDNDSRTYHI